MPAWAQVRPSSREKVFAEIAGNSYFFHFFNELQIIQSDDKQRDPLHAIVLASHMSQRIVKVQCQCRDNRKQYQRHCSVQRYQDSTKITGTSLFYLSHSFHNSFADWTFAGILINRRIPFKQKSRYCTRLPPFSGGKTYKKISIRAQLHFIQIHSNAVCGAVVAHKSCYLAVRSEQLKREIESAAVMAEGVEIAQPAWLWT